MNEAEYRMKNYGDRGGCYPSYCWFARDDTAAMLVVKNKSISLLRELNSVFM